MELITILEKTVSPGESLHHAAHTAGGPGPMPGRGVRCLRDGGLPLAPGKVGSREEGNHASSLC